MIKTKFVFAVSFVAMMAVGTGHAEIAGVSYVEQQVGVATTAANNAQTSANNANTAAGNAQTSADNAQDAADAAQASADAAALSAKTANDAVALKQDKLTAAQLDAANSGITSAKVSTYDGYATTIAGKQDKKLATEINDAVESAKDSYYPSVGLMETQIAATNNSLAGDIADLTTAVAGKQATLSAAQLAAVNSGITSTKVSTYDGYAATIAGKQATISDLATIRSGAAAGATALQKADIATGTSNGTISVDGSNVAVKGLGSAAYTASTAYATAAQGTLAASAVQPDDLADVATSGSYNDLTDKPTIPSGALASKSTITNADVADNAAIAQSKISGLTTALSGKQATISDLATIRSGAEAGATALQKADIATGTSNGTISVDGSNVAVKGLGSAAYTASTAYATAAQGTLAASAVQPDDLADVATSGSYNDLTDKPTIPSGALASKSTITNADVADNAAIAQSKISGLTTALSGKQATLTTAQLNAANSGITSAKVSTYDGYATTIAGKQNNMLATEITTAVSGAKDSYYPSVGLMETSIATANNDVMDSVNAKLASVSSSGTGSVVKAVAKDGTAVKATLGYIGSSDITDGSVALADLASNSVNSAKIVDSSIATADIANGAVTAAKTTGIYGFIPSGSEGASTTAAIWVE